MKSDELQRAFKTLADPTRMRLLALLDREELAVQELMEVLGMTQSRVSGHLKILREVGLLADRRQGTFVFYRFLAPADGEWRACWNLVRQSLRSDAAVQRDARLLQEVVEKRAVRTRAFFDDVGRDWDRIRGVFNDEALRARAISRLVPAGLHVAEIGTGTGVLAMDLARQGLQVTAVDHSPGMLAAARAKVEASGIPGVDLRQGDAEDLPLADDQVDATFAHMVLRYLARPGTAIAEMARVTRPGGSVVVIDFERHDLEWMRGELGVQWLGFAEDELVSWFELAGLEDLRVEHLASAAGAKELPAAFIASARRPLRAGA